MASQSVDQSCDICMADFKHWQLYNTFRCCSVKWCSECNDKITACPGCRYGSEISRPNSPAPESDDDRPPSTRVELCQTCEQLKPFESFTVKTCSKGHSDFFCDACILKPCPGCEFDPIKNQEDQAKAEIMDMQLDAIINS